MARKSKSSTAISTTDVKKAAAELAAMRRSLTSWLKFRQINDSIGVQGRDLAAEQDLADKLAALLEVILPDAQLPSADLRQNPRAAVELAQIALSGNAPVRASGPSAQGATHPWLWPVLIVGGLLLTVTTAIRSAADVAKDAEEKACIRAGACTDYGFWLKAGGLVALTWFAWKELGLGDVIKGRIRSSKGRS
jgi:hypothetical protein